jgi:hypothetical protein
MVIVETFHKGRLDGCYLQYGSKANGNNKWRSTPTLTVKYDDGSQQQWIFPEATLDSHNNEVTNHWNLNDHIGPH